MKSWKTYLGVSVAVATALSLAACNEHSSGEARLALTGKDYCTPFKGASTGSNASAGLAAPADPGAAFDDCVHRWSYSLAPALDPADVVAQASVDACGSALTALSQQTASPPPSGAAPDEQDQPGGASSAAMSQQTRMAEAKALFYVVQARAAGCAPPPANSLTTPPVG